MFRGPALIERLWQCKRISRLGFHRGVGGWQWFWMIGQRVWMLPELNGQADPSDVQRIVLQAAGALWFYRERPKGWRLLWRLLHEEKKGGINNSYFRAHSASMRFKYPGVFGLSKFPAGSSFFLWKVVWWRGLFKVQIPVQHSSLVPLDNSYISGPQFTDLQRGIIISTF